jgi:SHS2 domain-containing protein
MGKNCCLRHSDYALRGYDSPDSTQKSLGLLQTGRFRWRRKYGEYHLSAVTQGEVLDRDQHQERVDVKAVTLHRFQLEKTDDGWIAMVILDI